MPSVQCNNCGITFHKKPSEMKSKYGNNFCSPRCFQAYPPREKSPELRAKISATLKGIRRSPETRAKMSASRKGIVFSPEHRANISAAGKGKHQSEESKAKKSEALKGRHLTPEQIAKGVASRKGYHHTPETKTKISAKVKEQILLHPEIKIKLAWAGKGNKNALGYKHTEEAHLKMSVAALRNWADPEKKNRQIKCIFSSLQGKQTKPERMVEAILQEWCPREYAYVGTGRDVVINGCVPDFININGQKKVIEVFGDYWHSPNRTGKPTEQEEKDTIKAYKDFGFDCLILWEHEIKKQPEGVLDKIAQFVLNKTVLIKKNKGRQFVLSIGDK